MFKFTNENDFLEFSVNIEEEKSLPSFLDASVTISFRAGKFAGETSSYILKDDMAEFCRQLEKLERSRSGSVTLKDVSGDIDFTVKAIDTVGHLAIVCNLRHYGYLGAKSEEYKASGFLEIDPSQLVNFLNEWWVSVYQA